MTLAGQAEGSPRWSLALKGGYFAPSVEGWKREYGTEGNFRGGIDLAYKITRRLELGLDIGYFSDEGQALTLSGRVSGVRQTFRLFPLQAFLLYRFIFHEDQIIVPYAGGGYSHFTFRRLLENAKTIRGRFDGWHIRAGLQILLDGFDRVTAEAFEEEIGVSNTYLFFEGQYAKVNDFWSQPTNIGGWSSFSGLLFEF